MRGGLVVALACALAGCGRVGYDLAAAGGELDGGGAGDGGGSSPDAPVLGAFGEPVPLDPINQPGTSADDPSLTADQLELYFKSTRGPGGDPDIWVARRATVDDPWGEPEQVVELSENGGDDTPEVALDGLTIHLSSARPGTQGVDVHRATRASRSDPWGAPQRLAELSSAGDDYAAVFDQGERHLVLNRDVGGGNLDLLRATRATTADPWGDPSPIDELATDGYEADASLDASGTVLVFTSDRPGGAGGRDLWIATRPDPTAPFGPATLVAELATAADDEDPWIAPDLRTIYFVRNEGGDQQLYVATR